MIFIILDANYKNSMFFFHDYGDETINFNDFRYSGVEFYEFHDFRNSPVE